MLTIVTGKINSGKTTKILEIYNQSSIGDGFISIKNMEEDKVHSYDILRLSTNEKMPFVLHEQFLTEQVDIACKIGPYHFLKETFSYIELEIKEMILNGVSPIYLDEIGLLELYDQCFHSIFTELLHSGLDICVVIREDLIEQIIQKYNIQEYQILS